MGHQSSEQHRQGSTNYRVEVSGWDAMEAFFLEKSILCLDATSQQICLRSRLREGTVVFVKQLQPFGGEENFPVPYLVAENLSVESNGRMVVSITRIHPTPSYRQSVTSINEGRRNVA